MKAAAAVMAAMPLLGIGAAEVEVAPALSRTWSTEHLARRCDHARTQIALYAGLECVDLPNFYCDGSVPADFPAQGKKGFQFFDAIS